ncbi:MAG TPA: O-antigen ligase family protein [Candidatus Nanoarchaeia archaeon]|nr:O-antigen ligase family protein [Candidatus Nanoarchaeia archaeon]
MPPVVALAIFALMIAGMFYLDRERESCSPAVWISVIWIGIGASRMVSQWLGGGPQLDSPDQYLEGSPMDRVILGALVAAALSVLISRFGRTSRFVSINLPIVIFFVYCAISVVWSDFPMVAFKRWTKALGNIAVVLVVLTDPKPVVAIRRLFTRTAFLLIPLSILLIKYYPHLGRGYNRWSWMPYYTGVTTEKNALGALCLVFGLGSFWQLVRAYRSSETLNRGRHFIAHGMLLVMNIYVLALADSATSLACFVLGALMIVITSGRKYQRVGRIHAVVSVMLVVGLAMYFLQDVFASIVGALGRDTTLTGRTEIWSELFAMTFNPVLGTGFESFWLGSRAEYMWNKYYFHPNQAHNGYIETYINLGYVGVALLLLSIVWGYRNVVKSFRYRVEEAPLKLAFLIVALIYNMTEAAFKVMHPVWIAFLFATLLPELAPSTKEATDEIEETAQADNEQLASVPEAQPTPNPESAFLY